ncbi:MAG: two-component sensor histidine kinase, partial [Actinobacteria bacterium]|nr:two-component sensor histidine kinase [Actinomycetota bacterium]
DMLAGRAGEAGLPTTVQRDGQPRPLPAGAEVAAYRIIQESLTNAIKHAGPATATIRLEYDDSTVRIEIADTGRGLAPGAQSPGAGHGLVGMRERAAAVGGTLQAGPDPTGGYRVVAVLPAEPVPANGAEQEDGGTRAVPAGQGPREPGSRP